jgi:hypothetical protein
MLAGSELPMCDKCVADDRRIAEYQALGRSVLDRAALNGIAELISKLKAGKVARHPPDNA